MARLPLLVIVSAVLLAGCGGGGGGGDFGVRLDALCAESAAFNQQLPVRQAQENLTTEQVIELAREEGQRFVDGVRRLEAPDDLSAEVETLEGLLDPGAQVETATLQRLADAYADVGADGCADATRRSIDVARQGQQNAVPGG